MIKKIDAQSLKSLNQFLVTVIFLLFSAQSFSQISVSASSYESPNVPANVRDGSVDTRWSAQGDGEWLKLDLGSQQNLTGIKIAFYKGDQRSANFDIQVSTNNSSWSTVVNNASSSSNTIWNQTFNFNSVTARYIRYVGYGNSQNDWNSLTKVSVVKGGSGSSSSSSSTSSSSSGGCNVPADVLDLSNWKITIPFSSASGGSDGNTNNAAEITQPALDSYERQPYFTNSGCNYVQFRAHVGGATTSGSGYPRTELREMTSDGSDEIEWDSDNGTHSLDVTLRVTALPPVKSHITIAQIHDGDDDIITFRLEDTKLFLEIDGSDGPVADNNYQLGETITVSFVVSGGVTRAYYNGSFVGSIDEDYEDAYFKTGAYVQSACSGDKDVSGESCSSYGEVEIFDVSTSHN